jgi:outer membrane protein assembly factor BamB
MNRSRLLVAVGVILCLILSPVIALMPADTVQAQPANSAWPMFGQNPQRTGRSPYSGPGVPELKWSFTTDGSVSSSPAIGTDGTIYIGSYDNKLYAINPDGSQKWSFTTGYPIDSSPAIGADGTIYVGSRDNRLYAINPDGTQKWSFTTGYWVDSSPAIGADGTIYVGSCDNKLYAINPDGTQKWSFTTGDIITSSPAIGADGTIYVGSWDKKLYAINPDGSQKWSFATGGSLTGGEIFFSPAIGADGTIYVEPVDVYLYAMNPDGSQKWSFTTGGWITGGSPYTSLAIGADGTIYAGAVDANLYAIRPSGSLKWSFATEDTIGSSPAIGADGTIYVGSYDSKLYAIKPDGSQKWSFTTGNMVMSSPAIGTDGTIYVGSEDNKLYAITEGKEEYDLAISSTPGGSVFAPGEGTFTYIEGTEVNLVAEAEEGYDFVNWTGDVDTIPDVGDATTTITMEDDYSIAANFEEEPSEPSDEEPSGGACFIATAAYGTPMADEVGILREFRDEYLLTNSLGQAFVDLYYSTSPPVAQFITEHPSLKPVVRVGLSPAVVMSTAVVNTTKAEKAVIAGLLALVSVTVAVWLTRRRGRGSVYS